MNKKQILLSAALATAMAANAQVTIHVDASNPSVKVSPNLYGIFFEDINHAADGGLYAELISNRSFEDDDKNIPTWKTAAQEGAKINAQLINKGLLNKHRARLSNSQLLPPLTPQPLSSTRASGASMPYRAEPISSLSGLRVATRATSRRSSSMRRATRCMPRLPLVARLARSGLIIQLNSQPTPMMPRHSLPSWQMARVPSCWMW